MAPLVSIVIPTYNGADYLENAIQSVIKQTYQHIELIVLDDGSTDETPAIFKKYEHQFVCQRHDNMGQARTLNKGWGMATGEILSYLSADDVLLPHAVEEAVRLLELQPAVVVAYGDYQLIDEQSRFIRTVRAPEFSYKDTAIKLICQPGPGVFFRRAPFERSGGWSGQFRQMPDFDFWLRIGLFGPFLRIPIVCALYRVHEKSQTFANLDEARADEPISIMTSFFENRNRIPAPIWDRRKQSLSNAYLLSARLHLKSHRFRKGARMLAEAFRLYPVNTLSVRTIRLVGNALLNRPLHILVRRLRNGLKS